MDKKKALLNVFVSILFKIIILVLTLLTKRYLIIYVGNVANGVLSLYTSIIGFLAIADLGIGTAISFCMYKPIIDNDLSKVSALYRVFIKFYNIVGIVILISGLFLAPFLKYFTKDYGDINLSFTFILMLISVVLTYMFSAKTSVINAYKNNYVTTTFHSVALIGEGILQIIVLHIYKSFELFLFSKIIAVIIEWILTYIYFYRHHKILNTFKSKLDSKTKLEVSMKTKAMFMHKIGGLLVNTFDSIIISAFIGVVVLGKYNNYITIIIGMNSIIMLCFTPLTSIIGHFCINDCVETQIKYFNFFYGFNFLLGCFFYIGYFFAIDDFISIIFGQDLVLNRTIVFVITLNYFIQFMRTSVLTFRDATGTFYNDRYKPLVEGIINLILSIVFVKLIGLTGVILATILTNLFICHLVEPYVLFTHAFNKSTKKYYIVNYFSIVLFIITLLLCTNIRLNISNICISFIANGFLGISLSFIPIIFMLIINKDLRNILALNFRNFGHKFLHRLKRNR